MLIRSFLFAVALASAATAAQAHSLKELETALKSREQYFQPIGKDAPTFSLQDAKGHPVSLKDFRNKVIVLHFIYTHCPDVCPLHAERIADIQSLINQSQVLPLSSRPQSTSGDATACL
jgi:protein SCO1/2